MVALAVEFSIVVALFACLHWRERARGRARRVRVDQMRLPFDGKSDRR